MTNFNSDFKREGNQLPDFNHAEQAMNTPSLSPARARFVVQSIAKMSLSGGAYVTSAAETLMLCG
ncbi:hypothetical protein QN379_12020 [Glaciimonas sp. Gout2]|uniref:hypothetical protein n=1 Tax=unclassified Glaciimonas TaxID=2644401 RepID=UPI002B228CAB|nr:MULTISPECIES: hypothetical protein [unclassified Glaciimonas]MEB0013349.1 hypothetical protein [Glaciimonas sp. Cout2]MEB0082740.1 hypothetical protein [Glaciimonas sp. Gout2]